ncbi:MAG: TetR/AcrR family transcriptional regulator [Pseudomonadota bacterium]
MASKTKDRILVASLRLFNENGYDTVTTARISEEVNISEGNLWYHFRTKKDLVKTHQNALIRRIDARLAIRSTPETVLDAYAHFNRLMFEEVWEYQFLYRDQSEFGRTDPEVENKVARVYEHTTAILQKMYRHMIEAKHLSIPEDEIAPLADNVWMVIRYWPSFLRETRRVVKLDRMTLNAGIRHHFALFETHLTAKARNYFEANAYA